MGVGNLVTVKVYKVWLQQREVASLSLLLSPSSLILSLSAVFDYVS